MPEEPAEAEEGNRGSGGDNGKAGTGHCAIFSVIQGASNTEVSFADSEPARWLI